jgi:hypothetical protein
VKLFCNESGFVSVLQCDLLFAISCILVPFTYVCEYIVSCSANRLSDSGYLQSYALFALTSVRGGYVS